MYIIYNKQVLRGCSKPGSDIVCTSQVLLKAL